MLSREEVKSMLDQFESLRFCQDNMNGIEGLNEIIDCGERLIDTTTNTKFRDVPPYVASQLIVPYWERARYHSRREHYAQGKFQHAKDLDLAISDFDRLLNLLDISGDKKNNDFYFLAAYESRCECYLENGNAEAAISDANMYISAAMTSGKHNITKAYTLRAKCNLQIDKLDQAEKDITVALENAPNPSNERADALQLKEKIDKVKLPKKTLIILGLLMTLISLIPYETIL